jgi:hypothetical protein
VASERRFVMWILFVVPSPTPDGRTAEDLYRKRLDWISPEMQASARELGCRSHRAWYAADGSAFYALANWDSREGANDFFERWDIQDEPGEIAVHLQGDVGLVPNP